MTKKPKPDWEPAVDGWIECPICGGSGLLDLRPYRCEEMDCGSCDGTGWINA